MFFSSLDFLLSRIFAVFVVLHTPEGCDAVPAGAAAHCLKGLREKPGAETFFPDCPAPCGKHTTRPVSEKKLIVPNIYSCHLGNFFLGNDFFYFHLFKFLNIICQGNL